MSVCHRGSVGCALEHSCFVPNNCHKPWRLHTVYIYIYIGAVQDRTLAVGGVFKHVHFAPLLLEKFNMVSAIEEVIRSHDSSNAGILVWRRSPFLCFPWFSLFVRLHSFVVYGQVRNYRGKIVRTSWETVFCMESTWFDGLSMFCTWTVSSRLTGNRWTGNLSEIVEGVINLP